MTVHRIAAVARHDLTVLRRDPVPALMLIIMPFLLMVFMRPLSRASLVARGYHTANGAEQVVPGMTVFFAFFLVSSVGYAVYREHAWGTWPRLRATSLRPFELMLGKAATPLAIAAVQMTTLFAAGAIVMDLRLRGSVLALFLVAASFGVCLVALGMTLVALTRSIQQMNSTANILAVVSGGLSGAFAPVEDLSVWLQALARFTPGYWAMRGFEAILLERAGVGATLASIAVLVLFASLFVALAAVRFRVEETKRAWS